MNFQMFKLDLEMSEEPEIKLPIHQIILSASWETCMQVKKQRLEPDMEQQTGSKLEKDYVKDYDFFLNLRISLASIQIT